MFGSVDLHRRAEHTLLRWFYQFNGYRWPKDYPEELHTDPADDKRAYWRLCGERADRIQMELGYRVLKANKFGRDA